MKHNIINMRREEALASPAYWTTMIQMQIYESVYLFKNEHSLNKQQLTEYLNIPIHKTEQILHGDYNGDINEMVNILLKVGKKPTLKFN